ncbi:tetratricopeptide repeat protein [Candidatus Uabimicrobium sp. HlEnr_7]|uniref:tetratricopeptide repeat protein n=1 Tax=Candidatus Uabimicrobium helgolandensis TaxID=3095367 RepID=UPI0035589597
MKAKFFLLSMVAIMFVSLFFYHYNKKTKIDKPYLQELTMRVNFALKQNKIKEAIEVIQEIQRLYTNHPEVDRFYYILAQLYLTRDEFDRALQAIDFVIKKDVRPEYLLLKGRVYQQQQQYSEALNIYSTLIKQNYTPSLLASADIYLAQYEVKKAEQMIAKIPGHERGKYRDLVFIAGKIQMLLGNYEQAENLFHNFLMQNPYVFTAHIFYVRALSVQGKLNKAKEFYESHMQNPKKSDYSFYRSVYALTLSPFSAKKIYSELPKKTSLDYYYELRNYLTLGENKVVIELGKKKLRQIHHSKLRVKIQSLICESYLRLGNIDEAKKIASQNKIMVEIALAENDVESAEKICEQIKVGNNKQLFRQQIIKNRIAYYCKQYQKIIEETKSLEKKMLVGTSEYALLMQSVARAFLALKEYKRASEYFRKVYTQNTSLPDLILTSRLWDSVCQLLQQNKPQAEQIWQETSKIAWENYITDVRTTHLASCLLQGKEVECEFSLQNDALFFQGLYFLDKQKSQTVESLQKAQQKTPRRTFPSANIEYFLREKNERK